VQPQIDPAMLPLQRLYHWEKTSPQRDYFIQPFDGGQVRRYTWAQVGDEARRVAAWLKAQDWPAGSRIGILGKNSAGWIMADLAIWMAGHVSVPLYPMQTADNVRQIIEHSGCLACFIGKLDDTAMLAGLDNTLLTIALPLAEAPALARCTASWGDILERSTPLAGEPVRAGSDLCTIVYTSGTTGQAKGVMHSFDTLAAALQAVIPVVNFSPDDRMLSYLPLAHIMERSVLELASLHCGCTVYFAESLSTFADDLRRARPTLFVSVPRLWLKFQHGVLAQVPAAKLKRLLRIPIVRGLVRRKILKGLGLDQVRQCASGSAPLSADVKRWFADLGLEICEGYGMTEVGCTSHGQHAGDAPVGTVGPPAAGVQQRIDPETGEVQVLTPGATLGYYKAPELTAELFTADGWIHTGDKGVIDAHNHLTLIGRIKDNFKSSKGKYVAPGPIEHRLSQHEWVETCMVLGANLPQPLGLVVLAEAVRKQLPAGREAVEAGFAEHLKTVNAVLDPHEQLECIVLSCSPWSPDNGMLTPTLKVRRPQIEKHFASQVEVWVAQRRAVVWQE
jgi:long-chain acyl-CoA synthetase